MDLLVKSDKGYLKKVRNRANQLSMSTLMLKRFCESDLKSVESFRLRKFTAQQTFSEDEDEETGSVK